MRSRCHAASAWAEYGDVDGASARRGRTGIARPNGRAGDGPSPPQPMPVRHRVDRAVLDHRRKEWLGYFRQFVKGHP